MDQERTYQLPAREADDANPELLANEEPASFILSSEDKTLGRFVEAAFAPIGLVSTRVEGDKNGTPAVTDGDQLREGDAERPAHEAQPGALRGHGFRRPERGPARVHVGGGLRRVQEAPTRSRGGRGRGHVDAPHVLQLRVTAHHVFGVPPLRVTCYIILVKYFFDHMY